jgi:hypothetical protein
MRSFMNIKVGIELVVVEDGTNIYRWNKQKDLPPNIYDGIVTKVGRKYFTVSFSRSKGYVTDVEFHLEDLREKTNYAPDYSIHESREKYLEDLEADKLFFEIKEKYFTYRAGSWLTLDKIKAIQQIIEGE